MERLTEKYREKYLADVYDNENDDGGLGHAIPLDDVKVELLIQKLGNYEDLEEQCINKTTWSLRLLLKKWSEFFEDIQELYEYRKLEEQGLLPKLPCSIGSDVYFIPSKVTFDLNKLNEHEEGNRIYHQKVAKIVFTKNGWYLECDKDLEYGTGHILVDKLYKETWFLTQAEAEEALKRMERDR